MSKLSEKENIRTVIMAIEVAIRSLGPIYEECRDITNARRVSKLLDEAKQILQEMKINI